MTRRSKVPGQRRARGGAPAPAGALSGGRSGFSLLEVSALLLAAGIVAYQILAPPAVGLADNGDFDRVYQPIGLRSQASDYHFRFFRFFTPHFDVVAPRLPSQYVSSAQLLAGVARLYGSDLRGRDTFDVRVLGVLHLVVFLGGLALLLVGSRGWAPETRVVFALLLVFLFTDVGYAALFNSFFTAASSFLFLFLLAGIVLCLARGDHSAALSAGFWIAALLFVVSKPQESVQAPLLGLLAAGLARQGRGPGSLRPLLGAAAALCILAVVVHLATARDLKQAALYNAVFNEMLENSPDPPADLAELGLPPDWVRLVGTSPFRKGPIIDPEFRRVFFERVTYPRILLFYTRHPARLAAFARRGLSRSVLLRPLSLGNFAIEAGEPPGAQSNAFAVWSRGKAALAPLAVWLIPLFWVANGLVALRVWRRSPRADARCIGLALAVLAAMAILEYLTCLLGEGLKNLNRHLHSFNAMTDLALVADATAIASIAAAYWKARNRAPDASAVIARN